jgi:hypothetical protein
MSGVGVHSAQEKYYPLLEQTRTHNELSYVGPRQKEQLLAYLNGRIALGVLPCVR